ncbi:hypothetical protein HAX54_041214 [Datura stramonium]|uniref:Uncharacterized protein n=1 Tax=Datura stramonium TaxID=4076 RepID=A0ABS8VNQ2_DATST|nr:hypothetical protein [Datura stramonium]
MFGAPLSLSHQSVSQILEILDPSSARPPSLTRILVIFSKFGKLWGSTPTNSPKVLNDHLLRSSSWRGAPAIAPELMQFFQGAKDLAQERDEEGERKKDGVDISRGFQDVFLGTAHSRRGGAGSSEDVVPHNDDEE